MSTDANVQTVKNFFAAIGRGDREALLAPGRQTDPHPGIHRYASTGAGRAYGRVRAGVALAACGHRFGVEGE